MQRLGSVHVVCALVNSPRLLLKLNFCPTSIQIQNLHQKIANILRGYLTPCNRTLYDGNKDQIWKATVSNRKKLQQAKNLHAHVRNHQEHSVKMMTMSTFRVISKFDSVSQDGPAYDC